MKHWVTYPLISHTYDPTFVSKDAFDAIQEVIFENRDCTSNDCHVHPSPAGGLDSSDADTSYANLVDQPVQSMRYRLP